MTGSAVQVPMAANPYVGPRAFLPGEPLFGRAQETLQLTNLLVAERIVLLYSPSGAGKTSLIQAALVPRLQRMKFQVLPVIRVNLEPPDGLVESRYLYSTRLALQEALPAGSPNGQSLAGDLAAVPQAPDGRGVKILIFDQFEELLTLDPTDEEAKLAFFRQVGEALEAPNIWALFAMREDYLAALDPYLLQIPNRFRSRFRLELLGRVAALQAIQEPARAAGVEFADRAAEKLIDDLRRVRVQRTDGRLEVQAGPVVEPVQLQVVCRRLWELERPDPTVISEGDLAALGVVDGSLVDRSLSDYWARSAAVVATETGASERAIREWVDRRLITPAGDRNTLRMEPEASGGLDNDAIRGLIDAHLVRAEQRGGGIWFELAHDRLVTPVRRENAAWFRTHLSLLQQRADTWDLGDRPESLLLRDADLVEAERWAREHATGLLPVEQEYLQASRELQARRRRARQLRAMISLLGVVAVVLAIVAWIAYGQARQATQKAERLARNARSGELAAQSQALNESAPVRSLLLAVEAITATLSMNEPLHPSAHQALRQTLRDSHGEPVVEFPRLVGSLSVSDDERWLAALTEGSIYMLDLKSQPRDWMALDFAGKESIITGQSFQPGSSRYAAADMDGNLYLWSLDTPRSPPQILVSDLGGIQSLAFSPDGRRLAASSTSRGLQVWDMDLLKPIPSGGPDANISILAFSPNGHILAAGDTDGGVYLLDPAGSLLASWNMELVSPQAQTSQAGVAHRITSLSFSSDSRWLASGGLGSQVFVWDLTAANPLSEPKFLLTHRGDIYSMALSPDGNTLAANLGDSIIVWDLASPSPEDSPISYAGGSTRPQGLKFSPDGRWLAVLGGDATVRIWDLALAEFSGEPPEPLLLRPHDTEVWSLAFLSGNRLATGAEDGSLRLTDLDEIATGVDPIRLSSDPSSSPRFSGPDGNQLVAFHNGAIGAWDSGSLDVQVDGILPGSEGAVTLGDEIAASQTGNRIAAGVPGGIRIWDPNGVQLPTAGPFIPMPGALISLALSPDGNRLAAVQSVESSSGKVTGKAASGTADFSIVLYSLAADSSTSTSQILLEQPDLAYNLAFSPQGRWLAAWSSLDPGLYLWDLDREISAVEPVTVDTGTVPLQAVVFSSDQRRLVARAINGDLQWWQMGANGPTDQGHRAPIEHATQMALSSTRDWLWSGDLDGRVWAWPFDAGAEDRPVLLPGNHKDFVSALVLSPDERWLASGSVDGTIFLWDLAATDLNSAQPVTLQAGGQVTALVFSPDGRWLASTSEGGLELWRLRIDDLVRRACQSAGRNFTQEEWDQYFPDEAYHPTCPQFTSPGR